VVIAAAAVMVAVPGPAGGAEPAPLRVEIPVPAIGDLPAASMPAEVHLPDGEGPFPVVVYSHGRASKPKERAGLGHPIPAGHARYWMRKGFAVVAPIRPGYGTEGAPDRERSGTRLEADGSCGGSLRLGAASEAAAGAVEAAVGWVRHQSWAERNRILLVGTSVGGMATVVAASKNPPGVVGFVNFSGGAAGYPDRRPGASCAVGALTEVYRRAGRTVRVPNIWLYAENDRYWGAEAPRAWHGAFAGGGSPTRFVMTAPVPGEDGHKLMLRGGRMWSEHVDPFVAGLGFAVRPAAKPAAAPTPAGTAPAPPKPAFPTARFSWPRRE